MCKFCKKSLNQGVKYCSNKCQRDFEHSEYIKQWKLGLKTGERGISARNISRNITRFMKDKYGEECSICRWNKKNPVTGECPLEIDHIDGDHTNNFENNLRLICPNCHALSENYKNLNKGKGRKWRRDKYNKHTVK